MVSKPKMREILFRGKRAYSRGWVEGHLIIFPKSKITKIMVWNAADLDFDAIEVIPETVGQFTGLTDKNYKRIWEGDVVRFLRYVGTVVYENGCFGIAISEKIDWDYIAEEMEEYAGLGYVTACHNDNFISLWEILWNFNCLENVCNVVEVIGNIHDDPELLEVSNA